MARKTCEVCAQAFDESYSGQAYCHHCAMERLKAEPWISIERSDALSQKLDRIIELLEHIAEDVDVIRRTDNG